VADIEAKTDLIGGGRRLFSPGRNILGYSNLLRKVEQAFPRER